MKKLVFLLLLWVHMEGFAQFNFNYDSATNTLSVEYTECDPCALDTGNVNTLEACECRKECETPSEEALQALDDCIEYCDNTNWPYATDLDYCLDACEDELWRTIQDCRKECGDIPDQVRTPVQFQYRLFADWAPIPRHPFSDSVNLISTNPSNALEASAGGGIEISNWILPDPWPEIGSKSNTCFAIEIFILYDDGSVCRIVDSECFIIG